MGTQTEGCCRRVRVRHHHHHHPQPHHHHLLLVTSVQQWTGGGCGVHHPRPGGCRARYWVHSLQVLNVKLQHHTTNDIVLGSECVFLFLSGVSLIRVIITTCRNFKKK